MSANLEWSGMTELTRGIAALVPEVRATFKPIVVAAAERIKTRTEAAYASRGHESSGRGMRVETSQTPEDISARVVNPSPLAHLDEFGSANRYTADGWYRGRMPATPTMIPIAIEERERCNADLESALDRVRLGAR